VQKALVGSWAYAARPPGSLTEAQRTIVTVRAGNNVPVM